MVHWRDLFSSENEIDPTTELFIKRVIFFCLHSNRYIEVEELMRSVLIKSVGDAVNILSHRYQVQIERLVNRYPLSRATISLHLEYLYIHLHYFYERCYPRFARPVSFLLVLALGMEIIYLIWSRFPQVEKKEFTYATVYILSRLFSSREFTDHCSIESIAFRASHLTVTYAAILRFLRDNPRRLFENQIRIPLNYFDDVPRPEDLFSPENPVSTPSLSDSGVSTTSPAHGNTPSPPPPPVESPVPGAEIHGCMPRLRRFFPRMCAFRCAPRNFPRFRLFSRFRRFCLELPRPFE